MAALGGDRRWTTPADDRPARRRRRRSPRGRGPAGAQEPRDAAGARRWRGWDCPKRSPRNRFAGWSQRGDWIAETQRRLTQRREELARRQAELDSFAARIAQLAADAGVSLRVARRCSTNCTSLARRPRGSRHSSSAAKRFAASAGGFASPSESARTPIGRQKHRRRQLFIEVGVKDEQEFRQRALESAGTDVLRQQREAIARDIAAALGFAMLRRGDSPAVRKRLSRPAGRSIGRIAAAAGRRPVAIARAAGETRPAERATRIAGRRSADGLEATRSGRARKAAGGCDSPLAGAWPPRAACST